MFSHPQNFTELLQFKNYILNFFQIHRGNVAFPTKLIPIGMLDFGQLKNNKKPTKRFLQLAFKI